MTAEDEYAAADQLQRALSRAGCHAEVRPESGWSNRRTGRISLLLSTGDAVALAERLANTPAATP